MHVSCDAVISDTTYSAISCGKAEQSIQGPHNQAWKLPQSPRYDSEYNGMSGSSATELPIRFQQVVHEH